MDFFSPNTTDFHFYLSREKQVDFSYDKNWSYRSLIIGVETVGKNPKTTLCLKNEPIKTWNFSNQGYNWFIKNFFLFDFQEKSDLHFVNTNDIVFITVFMSADLIQKKEKEYGKEWYTFISEKNKNELRNLLCNYIIPPLVEMIIDFAYII